jgi:probable FeS assembly SUF system protein SufT
MPHEEIELLRDCQAEQIPLGTMVTLPKGSLVVITQALGDTYTVRLTTQGNLYRIAHRDADALGKTQPDGAVAEAVSTTDGPVTEEMVWDQLRNVYDPEIPINIVDLGLVYNLALESLPDGDSRVLVQMTLTAQGCGMGPSIARDAQNRIEVLPGVAEADVQVVWDPPWHPDMMSPEGKKRLGVE